MQFLFFLLIIIFHCLCLLLHFPLFILLLDFSILFSNSCYFFHIFTSSCFLCGPPSLSCLIFLKIRESFTACKAQRWSCLGVFGRPLMKAGVCRCRGGVWSWWGATSRRRPLVKSTVSIVALRLREVDLKNSLWGGGPSAHHAPSK